MENYSDSAKYFQALSDPKRLMIVDMISCGELCACKILEKFEMSQSTLSHHMKILCDCGILKARNEGKWTFYSLDEEVISKIKQLLFEVTSTKETCICNNDYEDTKI